jgi:hypothetical protein
LVLPWTPLMLAGVYAQTRANAPHAQQSRFLIGWFVLSALPFFFMRSFERYMLALIPAQIALCTEWVSGHPARTKVILLTVCMLVLALLSLLISFFALWFKLAEWQAVLALVVTIGGVVLAFRGASLESVAVSAALMFTCALGGLYPRLGINALPERLTTELSGSPTRMFDPPQPSLLSMRLKRSVQAFKPEEFSSSSAEKNLREIVFVEATHEEAFFDLLRKNGLTAEEQGRFRSFYSRRAWIRFARSDAGWPDWHAAFQSRSLEGLKSEFRYYLVARAAAAN